MSDAQRPQTVVAPGASRDPARWLVLAITLGCLLPFLGKAFHIDDPSFLFAARQLDVTPLDPWGFVAAWSGVVQPAHQHVNHPPLQAYLVWFGTRLFGFREAGLHAVLYAVALWGVAGAHACARLLCLRPGIATLAATLSPVFLVTSTTLMSDALFAATWTWSIVFWLRALAAADVGDAGAARRGFAGAAIATSACLMTRYNGVALVPLLALHLVLVRRSAWRALLWLALPLAVFAAYQWLAFVQHGHVPVRTAARYAALSNDGVTPFFDAVIGVVFAGGCVASAAAFAPLLWTWRALLAFAALGVSVVVAFPLGLGAAIGAPQSAPEFARAAWQVGLWFAVGVSIGALVCSDLARRRDAASLLLALWISGTFAFACVFNWTVSARALLPLAPAVGILIARRLDERAGGGVRAPSRGAIAAALVASAALALAVAAADAGLANASRRAAADTLARAHEIGAPVFFRGHWGWQWYLEQGGARPIDPLDGRIPAGAVVARPDWEGEDLWLRGMAADSLGDVAQARPAWLATMDRRLGAGFYANATHGPLPFAFGEVRAGRVTLERLHRGTAFGLGASGIERRPWMGPPEALPR
jgi:hypothetical protein